MKPARDSTVCALPGGGSGTRTHEIEAALKKKVLILHAAIGNGHVQVAKAIREALEMRYGAALEIEDIEVIRSKKLVNALHFIGNFLLEPLYDWLWHAGGIFKSLSFLALHTSPRYKRELAHIKAHQPDAVICTHVLPTTAIVRSWRQHPPVIAATTDQDIHTQWPPEVDAIFVANEKARQTALRLGIPPQNVHATGIPIRTRVGEIATQPLARKENRTVIILGGGQQTAPYLVTWPRIIRLAREIRRDSHTDVQWHLITGPGSHLRRLLRWLAPGFDALPHVHLHDYIPDLPRFMRQCSLVVTKPGGLITAEMLALGTPSILLRMGAGQEKANAQTILQAGAGQIARRRGSLLTQILNLLDAPQTLQAMRQAARALGRPNAAQAAAKIIWNLLS